MYFSMEKMEQKDRIDDQPSLYLGLWVGITVSFLLIQLLCQCDKYLEEQTNASLALYLLAEPARLHGWKGLRSLERTTLFLETSV